MQQTAAHLWSLMDPETCRRPTRRACRALCSDCGRCELGTRVQCTLLLLSAPGMLRAASGTEPAPWDSHNDSLAGLLVLRMPEPALSSHGPSEMGRNDRRGQEAPQGRRRVLGCGARAKLLCLRGGGGGGTGRENGVWSQASLERPRCAELRVLGWELRAGAGPRHAPTSAVSPLRFPFIPGNLALFLRDKDQPRNPLQIPAGGASLRLAPGSGRGAGHSGHSREAPGRRFASISFWEQSPRSREDLWRACCLVSVRGTGGWAGCGFIAPVFVLEA